MSIWKPLIGAGIIALSGCGGHSEPGPVPAGKAPPAATKSAAASTSKPQSAWTTYQSADGRYSVMMPAAPEVSSQSGQVYTTHLASCEQPGVSFTVTYFDPPPRALMPGMVQTTMKVNRDAGSRDVKWTLQSEENITISKDGTDWPGLASVMVCPAERYVSRLYAVGNRLYLLKVKHPSGTDNAADVAKFFDSFKIPDTPKSE